MTINGITRVEGITVGHYTMKEAATGCTVVLVPEGAAAGVDIRGSAPGTRETALLAPEMAVQAVHAVLLSGGSAYGLDAAAGVMQYLEERGVGFDTGAARVPIVPAAVLFDLAVGQSSIRPDKQAGYQACVNASGQAEEGSVGAGTGAAVGKVKGMDWACKGGIGTAHCQVDGGLVVGALVAVNPLGEVVDEKGKIIAGCRSETAGEFVPTMDILRTMSHQAKFVGNTTIGVVATNAQFDKAQCKKVAQMAQNGLARSIRPSHTLWDGDAIFALSVGRLQADVSLVGELAAQVVAGAVVRAVKKAVSLAGVPAVNG